MYVTLCQCICVTPSTDQLSFEHQTLLASGKSRTHLAPRSDVTQAFEVEDDVHLSSVPTQLLLHVQSHHSHQFQGVTLPNNTLAEMVVESHLSIFEMIFEMDVPRSGPE